jgi:hypothetical protein
MFLKFDYYIYLYISYLCTPIFHPIHLIDKKINIDYEPYLKCLIIDCIDINILAMGKNFRTLNFFEYIINKKRKLRIYFKSF